MGRILRRVRRADGAAAALGLAAVLAATWPAIAQQAARPRRDTSILLPFERQRLAARIAEAAETPALRALARRPAIASAFARYRRQGGLLPRLRFAGAFARTAGFTRAAGLDSDSPLAGLSRDRTLAFDLACTIPAARRGAFKVVDIDVSALDVGGTYPSPGTTIRLSVDVPAATWRSDRGLVSEASYGADGTLIVVPSPAPGTETSGRLVIDGAGATIDDSRRIVETATRRVRVNALRVACDRLPFSRLFGIGEP